MKQFWEEYYLGNDTPYEKPDSVMIELVSDMIPGKVADFGCGEGNNSVWLSRQGWDVYAVDYAPSALEAVKVFASQKGLDIHTKKGDITNIELKEKMDLILLSFVHFTHEDRVRLFANVARNLKPEGMVLYLGLTDINPEDIPADVNPSSFAHSSEIEAELEGFSIEYVSEEPRLIDMGDGDGETMQMAVTVLAKKL